MSTPLPHLSPLEVTERAACMCDHGDVCSSFAPGHALHLIQARLAAATPSDWVDGIVEHADAVTGELRVRTLEGGAQRSRRRPVHRSRCTGGITCSPSGACASTSPPPDDRPLSLSKGQGAVIMFFMSMQASMHALQD